MAPQPDSLVFPSLDKCLDGSSILISWKAAFEGLTSHTPFEDAEVDLETFLSDTAVVSCLGRPHSPYTAPSPETRSSFETKTAAINVTPDSRGRYDIQQIKEDSLWLSNEAKINEVSALRLVVIEWQSRAEQRLRLGAADPTDVQHATFGGQGLVEGRSNEDPFDSNDQRRMRLLQSYLADRRYILKLSEILIQAGMAIESSKVDGAQNAEARGWVERIGKTILNARIFDAAAASQGQRFLLECIEALQGRAGQLEAGSGFYREEGGRIQIEEDWSTTVITEMIHILQIIFHVLDFSGELVFSSVVSRWLSFMATYGFFDAFNPPFRSQTELLMPFQSLIALVSLAVLKLPSALEYMLTNPLPSGEKQKSAEIFLLNPEGMEYITEILTNAASNNSINASPLVFAWCILLQTLRECVLAERERQIEDENEPPSDDDGSGTEDGESHSPEAPRDSASRRKQPLRSGASFQANLYDQTLDRILLLSDEEDPIGYLANIAVNNCQVFDVISRLSTEQSLVVGSQHQSAFMRRTQLVLIGLVRSSLELVEYRSEVLGAIISIIDGGDKYWDFVDSASPTRATDVASLVLTDDEVFRPRLLETAYGRFPYEILPLLRLVRSLASSKELLRDSSQLYHASLIDNLASFTQLLPFGFREYETVREDENADQVVLTADLELFQERNPSSKQTPASTALVSSQGDDGIRILRGTSGRVILESAPPIIQWEYPLSGLRFLGKLLETSLPNSRFVFRGCDINENQDVASEVVEILATLLTSANKAADRGRNDTGAERILGEASDGLERNNDIISVVFEIFEHELHQQYHKQNAEANLDLLVGCMHFLHALIPIMPGRVWPLLARSSFLEIDGRGGRIGSIVAGVEIVSGRFEFLLSCVRTLEALIEDATSHAVARKCASVSTKNLRPFDQLGTGIPSKAMGKVLLAFVRPMVDVIESLDGWRFNVLEERLDVVTRLLTTFDDILLRVYGVDDISPVESKTTSVLSPSAEFLISSFLPSSSEGPSITAILKILESGCQLPSSTIAIETIQLWAIQVEKALKFATTLIQASDLLSKSKSGFIQQLFNSVQLLCRLYTIRASWRCPVLLLMKSLIVTSASEQENPPPLLGHLGPGKARSFLSVLSHLGKPLNDDQLEIELWGLLSSIISNRQQWFAVYLLQGTNARDSLAQRKDNRVTRNRVLLEVALDEWCKLDLSADLRKGSAILDFIAAAQDHWAWAMSSLKGHPKFLFSITDYIKDTKVKGYLSNNGQSIEDCLKIRTIAYIGEILAMCIHQSRESRDISWAKRILDNLDFFVTHAVAVPNYNASLHANLRKNFEEKFTGVTLSSFKRTSMNVQPFGAGYFYNTALGDKMMSFDRSWQGIRGPGLAEEMRRANFNLSLVQAQVYLLYSWRLLTSQLCQSLPKEPALHRVLVRIVQDCLQSNTMMNPPEHIFENLVRVRSDFAFSLMHHLASAKPEEEETKRLLKMIWHTIRDSGTNFELALAEGDATYYRSLLKILFLALRARVATAKPDASFRESKSWQEDVQIVSAVLDLLLGRSMRDLASAIHEHPQTSSPEDIALVTAIVQTALQVPGVESVYPRLRDVVVAAGTARVATTLFSWSDQISIPNAPNDNNRDPVYGELAVLFLVELSSISTVAEQLARDGILSQLSNANLAAVIRQGVSPSERHDQCLYSIWQRGFLPLCLNLLQSIGPQIASEVSAFLIQYTTQLSHASLRLDCKLVPTSESPFAGCLTPAIVSEIHSLALIDRILTGFRQAGASIGVLPNDIPPLQGWDPAAVKEDVDFWLQSRRVLRERIIPLGEKQTEMTHSKPRSAIYECENRLEELVVVELTALAGLLDGD